MGKRPSRMQGHFVFGNWGGGGATIFGQDHKFLNMMGPWLGRVGPMCSNMSSNEKNPNDHPL